MNNRDIKTVVGEWLSNLTSSPVIKSAIHADLSSMYHQDFIIISNLCNGYGYIPQISLTVIDGAKEWYKQANKSFLEASNLSEQTKFAVSLEIDKNAESEKQRWLRVLDDKGIIITVE